VGRELCVRIVPRDDATADERALIRLVLEMHEPAFDFDWDGAEYRVYDDAPHNPKRLRKALMHALHQSEASDAVLLPLAVGIWDEADERYIFPGVVEAEPEAAPEPAVPLDSIGWCVRVSAASAFEWRTLRLELDRRGRTVIGEPEHAYEVGALDEADATAFARDLKTLACVGEVAITPLGRLRRWLVRERLLGNYAD
jgi:hypothetical protein